MAHKTIMIQEDVYELLSALKKPSESFNDVIKQLIRKTNDLSPFFGILDNTTADLIIEGIIKSKSDTNDSLKNEKLISEGE